MSDSEDGLSGLGDAEVPCEVDDEAGDKEKYDIPSSPELVCAGCMQTSKCQCPIEALKGAKGQKRRLAWGKTSTRKVKCTKTRKRVRVIRKSGEWCRNCYNIWRLRFKRKYKNDMTKFKTDMKDKRKGLKQQFDNIHSEYLHQRAGGRCRVTSLTGRVIARQHNEVKIQHPREVFYSLNKYKEKFGDPKLTKARVSKLPIKNRGILAGVIVREGEEGVFPIERSTCIQATKEYVLDDGTCVLDEGQLDEALQAFDEEEALDSKWPVVPHSGVLTLEETAKRAEAAGSGIADGDSTWAGMVGDGVEASSGDGSDSSSGDSDSDSCSESLASADANKVVPSVTPQNNPRRGSGGDGGGADASASRAPPRPSPDAKRRKVLNGSATKQPASRSSHKSPAKTSQSELETEDQDHEGMRDLEADKLTGVLQAIIRDFSTGAHMRLAGRDRQTMLREWKSHLEAALVCWKRVAVSKSVATRSQAAPLKGLMDDLQKLAGLVKVFGKYRDIPFADLEAAWDQAAGSVKLPPAMEAQMVAKKMEGLIADEEFSEALRLLSIATPKADEAAACKWGVCAISDPGTQAETCADVATKLFCAVFTYRLPKNVSEEQATTQAADFMKKVEGLALPSALREEASLIDCILNSQACKSAEELDKAVEKVAAAQMIKREKGILSAFATSKVGRAALKSAADLAKSTAQNHLALEQLSRAAVLCKELVSKDMTTADGTGDINSAKALFMDALANFSALPKTELQLNLIQDGVGNMDTALGSAFAVGVARVAAAATMSEDDEATFDGQGLEKASAAMQHARAAHAEVKAKLAALSIPVKESEEDWDLRAAFADVVALVVRKRQQFPAGYATASPILVASFAQALRNATPEHAESFSETLTDTVPDLEQAMSALLQETNAALKDTTSFLAASVAPHVIKKLPLQPDFQLKSFGADNKLAADLVPKLTALQLADVMQQCDTIKGAIKVLQGGGDEGSGYPDMAFLDTLVVAVPPLVAIAKCQNLELAPPVDDEKPPPSAQMEKFLDAFNEATRECNAFATADHEGLDVSISKQNVKAWLELTSASVVAWARSMMTKVETISTELQGLLIDPKPILKKFDERSQQLIQLEHRLRIVELIKILNGTEGGGIKLMQKFVDVLAGTDEKHDDLNDLLQKAKTQRHSARCLVTYRTAAVLIVKKKVADIPKFYQESRSLGVPLPKELKERLDAL